MLWLILPSMESSVSGGNTTHFVMTIIWFPYQQTPNRCVVMLYFRSDFQMLFVLQGIKRELPCQTEGSLKPIFHWKWGWSWPPNANEIYTKKNEMYMTINRILRWDPTPPIFQRLASGVGVGANANFRFGVGGLASGVWRRGFGVGGLASGV